MRCSVSFVSMLLFALVCSCDVPVNTCAVSSLDGVNGEETCTSLVAGDPLGCSQRPSAPAGYAVWGHSDIHIGVYGTSTQFPGVGVLGENAGNGAGVVGYAYGPVGIGVAASSKENIGIRTDGGGAGLVATNMNNPYVARLATKNYAAEFYGPVLLLGAFNAQSISTRIDHPADSSKYLHHAAVQSHEMKNIYDGIVVLDESGAATVTLPSWFSALNGEFRYQLTSLGSPARVYVSREIYGNQFQVQGDVPGARVSWQVTGVRRDAWAEAHPMVVERSKQPAGERD